MERVHGVDVQPKKVSKLKILILLFISLFAAAGLSGYGWCWNKYQSMYRSMDISLLGKEPPRSTLFYDRSGEVMTELTNAKMEYIPFDQFPKTMLDAVVAVEDTRFYEHKGVDFYGIARALYRNLKSGYTVEGGSTITQQLAKTMLFSTEQTYTRKLNEAVASIKIEKTYSKDQILELYLNHIYFGEGAWGLQRAAQTYFGKNASELTLSECALLAAIPKSPTNYSPVKKPEQSKDRRNLVLNLMAERGKITAQQRDDAKKEEIVLAPKSELKSARLYSSYIDHVINEAIEKYGLTEQQILSSGLQIYTNMETKVQKAAEEVYNNTSYFPLDKGGLQSGIVLMETQTGALLGIVGSRNPNREFRQFNYATQNERQPGSTIKPILVYAPALSEGYGPADLIYDQETDFGGGYKPMNYKKQFHGWITLEEALVQSYNIPAVAMLKEIGIDKGMKFAKKAGLPLQDSDRTFGIALGGMSKGTSPLQMAQAYSMFANNGNMAKAYAITKIVDSQGQLVGEEAKPQLQPMLDPSVAYTMTMILEKVVSEGTGQNAQMDRPVAGKTGTTQLPDIAEFKDKYGNQLDGSKDAWFVGYTPDIVGAVWLGYEKTNREHYLTTTGGKYPASLFKEVVSRALQGSPITAFATPESYAAIIGGTKRINGTKETMFADISGRGRTQQQQPTVEAVTAPAADNQQGVDPVNTPDKLTNPKENGKPQVETAGSGAAGDGTGPAAVRTAGGVAAKPDCGAASGTTAGAARGSDAVKASSPTGGAAAVTAGCGDAVKAGSSSSGGTSPGTTGSGDAAKAGSTSPGGTSPGTTSSGDAGKAGSTSSGSTSPGTTGSGDAAKAGSTSSGSTSPGTTGSGDAAKAGSTSSGGTTPGRTGSGDAAKAAGSTSSGGTSPGTTGSGDAAKAGGTTTVKSSSP